jgi:hypothetical protein
MLVSVCFHNLVTYAQRPQDLNLYRECSECVNTLDLGLSSYMGCRWDLAEWLDRCASIPKITGSNSSGGSELTFRSDLLLTARGIPSSARVVRERSLILHVCRVNPGNTLCNQRLEPPGGAE